MDGLSTIRNITRTYRHITRYRRILSILLRNGFGYLFKDLRIHRPSGLFRKNGKNTPDESEHEGSTAYAERLRATLIELGPTFVKLGQLLSCRPDILPVVLVNELAKLRDHVPPFPFSEVRRIFQEDLHGQIEDFFSAFNEKPSGAASIAQGHHAVLKDGTEVFVKIQRPGIRNDINVDLEILAYLAKRLEMDNSSIRFLKPTKIVEEFAASLERELDFSSEVSNMTSFARQFGKRAGLRIPAPHRELCSRRILTMDFERGLRGDDIEGMKHSGINPREVADLGVELLLEQFFDHGFFHADPHPGNMFIQPGPTICYIDFGVMGRLTRDEVDTFGLLMKQILEGDNRAITKTVLKMTTSEIQPDPDELERDITTLVDCHIRGNIAQMNVVQLIQDFYTICHRQKLCLRPNIYQMLKALGYADAMGRKLAPDFLILGQLRPFVMRQSFKRLSPKRNAKRVMDILLDWHELLKVLPAQTQGIIKSLLGGRLAFHHTLDDFPEFNQTITHSFNRLCAGVVLSGMLIASALVLLAGTPPLFYGVSILGLVGFLQSLIVGTIILWSIISSGKKE